MRDDYDPQVQAGGAAGPHLQHLQGPPHQGRPVLRFPGHHQHAGYGGVVVQHADSHSGGFQPTGGHVGVMQLAGSTAGVGRVGGSLGAATAAAAAREGRDRWDGGSGVGLPSPGAAMVRGPDGAGAPGSVPGPPPPPPPPYGADAPSAPPSAGEGIGDVETLKQYLSRAQAGTGQVAAAIAAVTFQPRAAAFTSLIQAASKAKDSRKALEILHAMRDIAGVTPNTFTYSALISVLAKCGQWELAEHYFEELQAQGADDPNLRPNTVTFSALLHAYEKGGQLDRALNAFQRQLDARVDPDLITFSSLLSACERAGRGEAAASLLDVMHGFGLSGTPAMYASAMAAAGRDYNLILEIFLGMQCANVAPTQGTLSQALAAAATAAAVDDACELAAAGLAASIRPTPEASRAMLAALVVAGRRQEADRLSRAWRERDHEQGRFATPASPSRRVNASTPSSHLRPPVRPAPSSARQDPAAWRHPAHNAPVSPRQPAAPLPRGPTVGLGSGPVPPPRPLPAASGGDKDAAVAAAAPSAFPAPPSPAAHVAPTFGQTDPRVEMSGGVSGGSPPRHQGRQARAPRHVPPQAARPVPASEEVPAAETTATGTGEAAPAGETAPAAQPAREVPEGPGDPAACEDSRASSSPHETPLASATKPASPGALNRSSSLTTDSLITPRPASSKPTASTQEDVGEGDSLAPGSLRRTRSQPTLAPASHDLEVDRASSVAMAVTV